MANKIYIIRHLTIRGNVAWVKSVCATIATVDHQKIFPIKIFAFSVSFWLQDFDPNSLGQSGTQPGQARQFGTRYTILAMRHQRSEVSLNYIQELESQRQDQSQHPLFFLKFFSAFEHVKSLLIMGPNNTKNSSLKCDFHIIKP